MWTRFGVVDLRPCQIFSLLISISYDMLPIFVRIVLANPLTNLKHVPNNLVTWHRWRFLKPSSLALAH